MSLTHPAGIRLFIPTIGTMLVLLEDWKFPLHEESRNWKFSKEFRLGYEEYTYNRRGQPARADKITLPAGTVLKVDRIYIRKGGEDMKKFDSVTFWCNTHVKPRVAKRDGLPRGRFWAKLDDVNRLHVELWQEEAA